jgi:radical SAM protein with 4Fe4S-binding SPASM domain
MAETNNLYFQIHLTGDCNLSCAHCYDIHKSQRTYLTSEQFDYVLNEVLNYKNFLGAEAYRVNFTGGEPTLSPILFDCMRKVRQAGFNNIALLTNGTLITEEIMQKLAKEGCSYVQVCIEGDKEPHNAIRCGTWDQVISAWEIGKRYGMKVVNQTSVSVMNYKQIDSIISTAYEHNIFRCVFIRLFPHSSEIGHLSAEQWFEVLEKIYYDYYLGHEKYRNFIIVRDILWSNLFVNSEYNCVYGLQYPNYVTVECNGDVYLCRKSNIKIGNIFERNLIDIYKSNELTKSMIDRENLNEQCRSCGKGKVGICGGCRGMAHLFYHDIFERDPQCIINKLYPPSSNFLSDNLKLRNRGTIKIQGIDIDLQELMEYMRITDGDAPGLTDMVERKTIVNAAIKQNLQVGEEELQDAFDTFRIVMGLYTAKDTLEWLDELNVTLEGLLNFLETNLLCYKFKNKSEVKLN